jgi:multicomponent Na+:H+ antiporter subunit F
MSLLVIAVVAPAIVYIAGVALTLAVILAVLRLLMGPTLADRVVALDLLAILVVGIIATESIYTDEPVYVDVAIVTALISFLGTVAFARFIERRVMRQRSGQ